MSNIINCFPPLSEEMIIQSALDRLAKEKKDFESFKGTKTFHKLLQCYQLLNNSHVIDNMGANYTYFADGIAEDVYDTLCKFVEEYPYFAAVILKSKGSFTGCLAYAIHNFLPDEDDNQCEKAQKIRTLQYVCKSDFFVYSKAVEFYFEGASIKFNMEIVKPDGFADIPITARDINEQTDYKSALNDAQAELIAEEKRKEEAKRKEEEKKKKKADKEKKKREAEKRKKKAEEFKKAQQSFFDVSDDNSEPAAVPTLMPSPPVVVKAKKKSEKEEPKDDSLQLTLF